MKEKVYNKYTIPKYTILVVFLLTWPKSEMMEWSWNYLVGLKNIIGLQFELLAVNSMLESIMGVFNWNLCVM